MTCYHILPNLSPCVNPRLGYPLQISEDKQRQLRTQTVSLDDISKHAHRHVGIIIHTWLGAFLFKCSNGNDSGGGRWSFSSPRRTRPVDRRLQLVDQLVDFLTQISAQRPQVTQNVYHTRTSPGGSRDNK